MGKSQGENSKDGNQAGGKSPISSPSTKPKNSAHHSDRSPKNKDGEKLRERLTKSKMVWRKESMEKRPRSGPMVAKYGMTKASNLKLDTSLAQPVRGSLRPTSPTYESAFKRQVVNRPVSPRSEGNKAISHARSFNRGRRPPSPNVTPEDLYKKRIQKAKKAKLYLLQQAGPNSFIIGGGDAEDHRHKVTIGAQSCSCGRGPHCIHIMFVMIRVFQLSESDNLMQAKVLKNFEVESLFRKYEARRKQRLTRAHKPALVSSTSVESDNSSASGDGTSPDNNDCSDSHSRMETCPICLLELVTESQEQELVQCSHCHNKLHHACMAYWYQLLKREGDALNCPLCRSAWTSVDTASFEKRSGADNPAPEPAPSPDVYSASPNSLGVSPVSGFSEIEPRTLLPRSQPIPAEHTDKAQPWIQMFGEDLIGCLFMKNEWVVRETALRHLSREIIVYLTSASPTGSPLVEIESSAPVVTRVDDVLKISCQIMEMMMQDPVYKVYVSSLRALRTMLSYCTVADVTQLKQYLKPVVKCIIFKCADGNRKTNQLSISTLIEFSKDQDGELALAKELNVSAQQGLGGCLYVLECCVTDTDIENPPIQWLNGHLLTMKELLEQFSERFTTTESESEEFHAIANDILLPIIEFAVQTLARSGLPPRTAKYSKRVILHCAKHLSVLHGMNIRVRQLLVNVEPELRARLERRVIEMAMGAHQAALDSADKSQPAELSEPRVGSPPPPSEHSQIPKPHKSRHPLFGIIYPATLKSVSMSSRDNEATAGVSRLPRPVQHRRSNSYTEAVYQEPDSDSSSMDDDDSSGLSSNPTLNSTTDSFLNFSQASSAFNSSQHASDFAPTCTAVQNSSLPGTPRSDNDSINEQRPTVAVVQHVDLSHDIVPITSAPPRSTDMDVVDGHLPTKHLPTNEAADEVDGQLHHRSAARSLLMMMGESTESVESVEADNLAITSPCQPVSEEAEGSEQVSADYGKTSELSASNDETAQMTSPHSAMTPAQELITSSPNAVTSSDIVIDVAADDNEADDTLTGAAGVICSSGESDGESQGQVAGHSPDPKRKIARGRVVSGNKPHILHRHQHDESDVEEEVDSAFDCVDGIRPQISAERSGTLSPPPSLHRDTSYGFDVQSGAEVWNGGDGNFQSNYPSDSESGTDNISASVSLDVMTSEDELDNLSEDEFDRQSSSNRLSPGRQQKKSSLPFKGYKKHSRSRTDPLRLGREPRTGSNSPRYHSDPQAADSTTTSSSSTTPRTPPVSSSSPHIDEQSDNLPDNTVRTSAAVERPQARPTVTAAHGKNSGGNVSRSLTFSEPARREKSATLRSHHSMRAHKGPGNSQIPRSKHKIIKPSSAVPPMVVEVSGESGTQSASPSVGQQRSESRQDVLPSKSPVTMRSKSSMSGKSSKAVSITAAGASKPVGRAGSPVIPSAIRAITPPNSPLKDQSYRRSATPPDSPPAIRDTRPTSSPTPLQQERTSSPTQTQIVKSKPHMRPVSSPQNLHAGAAGEISRSPSPPTQPVTAVVRPQKGRASTSRDHEPRPSTSSAGMPPPQISVLRSGDMATPSLPIQRQTSSNVVGGILATSTSGSSEDHKTGSDSLYVDDLSDSAIASPYEKPVSFKDEVHLFSPRESPAKSGDCHCKDEVELEEAIALAKAMELSTEQSALPHVPGLSARRKEETITIHIQPDQTDSSGDEIQYIENEHWKRGMMIGTGAFSTCYQCRDVKTGIIMAVKQISFCRNSESEQDSICNAVIDEIRMMATLNHPNIVRILGATQTGAHFNMFVEWMPGGSVSYLLEKYGAFSEPVITSYTQQVLMGLAYLHDHQILHRDMKGANLLVDSTGKHLRIGDFGACAQLASSMTGAGELKGQLLGTIAFMAPEVLRGEHYGRACDVWSVGCVVIEMVTTKPPWNASNVSNHLKLIFMIASANNSPPIPENLPPAIKDLMLRCLEPEAKNRPPAKELLSHPLFTRSAYIRR